MQTKFEEPENVICLHMPANEASINGLQYRFVPQDTLIKTQISVKQKKLCYEKWEEIFLTID